MYSRLVGLGRGCISRLVAGNSRGIVAEMKCVNEIFIVKKLLSLLIYVNGCKNKHSKIVFECLPPKRQLLATVTLHFIDMPKNSPLLLYFTNEPFVISLHPLISVSHANVDRQMARA